MEAEAEAAEVVLFENHLEPEALVKKKLGAEAEAIIKKFRWKQKQKRLKLFVNSSLDFMFECVLLFFRLDFFLFPSSFSC